MKQFQNFEEENIHYWTGRTDGYSNVNQEELASDQKTVWGRVLAEKIAAHFPKKAPEEAYREWVRVLKKNGLLLNFDANWYRYLWDEKAQKEHEKDRKNLSTSDVRDETEGTDVAAMEAIARQTLLSEKQRPEWDLTVLREAGMEATADPEIRKAVRTKEERINNASTPMFLVEGVKKDA